MFENCFRNAVVSSNWTPELDSFLLAMLSDDFASILLGLSFTVKSFYVIFRDRVRHLFIFTSDINNRVIPENPCIDNVSLVFLSNLSNIGSLK